MSRIYNFSAGPATLPTEVLQTAKDELLDYKGSGTSIMEMSHRGTHYSEVDQQAKDRLKKLLNLDNNYDVLFLQGGASTQFMQVPFNYLGDGDTADYINTGAWSQKAIKEAKLFGNVHVAYSSEDLNFNKIPKDNELNFSENPQFVHFTSNNTIFGTQFRNEPQSNGKPLICDASSDFLSRAIDIKRYGLVYAGAQKNLGPAGVTIVIIRKDFIDEVRRSNIPTILKYSTHAEKLFHTPPTFAVYMVNLVLKWVEEKGGVEYFEKLNAQKAELLYSVIDENDFYTGTAEKNSRSYMNVTFRLPSEELEKEFIKVAAENNLVALKGHRSVGGIRASIYNAMSLEGVQALADLMKSFRKES